MKTLAEEDPQLRGMYWVQDAGLCSGVYAVQEGRTLIDTGNMYGLIDELQDIGPLERIERILLTHSHFDHVGGMAELFQLVSPDLYLHRMAREYLKLHRKPFPSFFEALEKDDKIRFLDDGDVIEGDPALRAIHTPGHTAGDLCFFDERSGALFSGDVVLPHKLNTGAALTKPDEFCGGRLVDKIESLRKLLRLPVRHLMPGHGEPVIGKGADQIKIALFTLYKAHYEAQPELAWIGMGYDMLEIGKLEDAKQCSAKASQIAPDSAELRGLKERIEGTGR